MISTINQLYHSRDLLWAWTNRIVRGRYQQSVLGMLWIIVQPLASVTIFSIIFTLFIPVDTGQIPYPVFSYVALLPWTLFASSLSDMTESLVGNMDLVMKIYFPREVLPLAAMLARLLDYLVGLGLLVVLMFLFGVPVFVVGWVFLPLILIVQLMLMIGLGYTLAAANVFYRDVRSFFALAIQILFYASPIIYPVSTVPERLRSFYYLNPMVGVLESYRAVLLYNSTPGFSLLISALVSFLVFLGGYWFFKRVEFQFADIV